MGKAAAATAGAAAVAAGSRGERQGHLLDLLGRRRPEAQRHLEAGHVVTELQPGVVQLGHRLDEAEAEAAAPILSGWDGPTGQTLRADRNRMLDLWAWTIRADSPLTAGCRAAWAEWFIAMNQMTVSGIDPESWHFPNTPELEYMTLDEAAARLRNLAAT